MNLSLNPFKKKAAAEYPFRTSTRNIADVFRDPWLVQDHAPVSLLQTPSGLHHMPQAPNDLRHPRERVALGKRADALKDELDSLHERALQLDNSPLDLNPESGVVVLDGWRDGERSYSGTVQPGAMQLKSKLEEGRLRSYQTLTKSNGGDYGKTTQEVRDRLFGRDEAERSEKLSPVRNSGVGPSSPAPLFEYTATDWLSPEKLVEEEVPQGKLARPGQPARPAHPEQNLFVVDGALELGARYPRTPEEARKQAEIAGAPAEATALLQLVDGVRRAALLADQGPLDRDPRPDFVLLDGAEIEGRVLTGALDNSNGRGQGPVMSFVSDNSRELFATSDLQPTWSTHSLLPNSYVYANEDYLAQLTPGKTELGQGVVSLKVVDADPQFGYFSKL